jgi:hypothetical protein
MSCLFLCFSNGLTREARGGGPCLVHGWRTGRQPGVVFFFASSFFVSSP